MKCTFKKSNLFFVGILSATDLESRIRIRVSVVRGSIPQCHGSTTLIEIWERDTLAKTSKIFIILIAKPESGSGWIGNALAQLAQWCKMLEPEPGSGNKSCTSVCNLHQFHAIQTRVAAWCWFGSSLSCYEVMFLFNKERVIDMKSRIWIHIKTLQILANRYIIEK